MNFCRKTFRSVLVLVIFIAIAPIAFFASYYMHLREVSVHQSLQNQRVDLTQLSNEKHMLNAYAVRLNRDAELGNFVKTITDKNSQWKTPAQQLRIQLTDGIKSTVASNNNVSSAELDWLDVQSGEASEDVDMQKLWLSAIVKSVPHAIDLVSSIEAMARPFPIQVHGCHYERNREFTGITARCLLVLESWSLPFVSPSEIQPASDTASLQPISNETKSSVDLSHWSIFNAGHLIKKVLIDESKESPKTKGLGALSKSDSLKSKAIINGPAGRLVIHALSR